MQMCRADPHFAKGGSYISVSWNKLWTAWGKRIDVAGLTLQWMGDKSFYSYSPTTPTKKNLENSKPAFET